ASGQIRVEGYQTDRLSGAGCRIPSAGHAGRAPRVEAEPPHPEDECSEGRQGHRVTANRPGVRIELAEARAEYQGPRKSRPAANAVHDGRASEIDEAGQPDAIQEPAA